MVRIHEIAKEAGFTSKEVLEKAAEMGLDYKSPSNSVSPEIANAIYEFISTGVILPIVEQEIAKTAKKKTTAKSSKTAAKTGAKTAAKAAGKGKSEKSATAAEKGSAGGGAVGGGAAAGGAADGAANSSARGAKSGASGEGNSGAVGKAGAGKSAGAAGKSAASAAKGATGSAGGAGDAAGGGADADAAGAGAGAGAADGAGGAGGAGVGKSAADASLSGRPSKTQSSGGSYPGADANGKSPAGTTTAAAASTTPSTHADSPAAPARNDFEQRRRGLVIVKKKSAQKSPAATGSEPLKTRSNSGKEPMSFAAIFAASEENLKKKKAKKAAPAQKREHGGRMEFDSNFADFNDDDSADVMLPDFTFATAPKPEPERTRTQQQTQQRSFQQAAFGNQPTGIARRGRKKSKFYKKDASKNEAITAVQIPKEIRLYELAEKLGKRDSELISILFKQGMMTTKNDFLDEEVIELLGLEFGIDISFFDEAAEFDYEAHYEDAQDELPDARVPVVTIMGHVDHGKTSLLDYIRSSRVASGEAGGITQHVGAYMVEKNSKNITFIDTPGHEAFSAMRARGASVTDIVIIVVAADDGVKPQTKEAISHAKAAGVPIIVAINKIDKEAANPDNVKAQMAELEIMPTEWGGQHEFVELSARTGQGVEELLEIILLQAELLELKANASAAAKANIVESSLQKGRGVVTTVIMQNGTLRQGDTVVAGIAYGRIKSITDSRGERLECIRPGECGVIMGLSEIPDAGETLISVATDKEAREYAQKRHDYLRQKELSKSTKVSLDELSAKIKEGNLKSLPLILKADVGGTLEAIKSSLEKLSNDEVRVDIIHGGVGGISAGDISLAQASGGVIVGFNVRPTGEIKEAAKAAKVEVKTYNVIYNLIDEIKAILGGLMSPIISEEQLGQAQIRQVINVPKVGQIAGCMVTDGSIVRGAKIRVIREGVVVFEGEINSLKRFKDDAKEVAKGYECGVGIEGFNDMREGDFIESYKEVENQVVL